MALCVNVPPLPRPASSFFLTPPLSPILAYIYTQVIYRETNMKASSRSVPITAQRLVLVALLLLALIAAFKWHGILVSSVHKKY